MSKNKQFLGIDVSKDVLDVYDYQGNWHQFKNDISGFKELCSYAGITPTIRESGSSMKGSPRISKMGNPELRNLLFMCSF